MNKKLASSLFLAGGMTLTGGAQALVITDSFSNAFQTTEITQTGSLDFFNSSLGSLNSVTLTLSGNSLSESLLTNTAANSQFFSFDSILNFFFDLSSIGVATPAPAFTTTLATTGGFVSLASNASLSLGPNSDSGSLTLTFPGSGLPSIFAGAAGSSFNVGCSTISGSTFNGGGGNITNNQTTTANCAAEIAYDYTPSTSVPEPTVLWLFGAGLLGFAGMRKKLS